LGQFLTHYLDENLTILRNTCKWKSMRGFPGVLTGRIAAFGTAVAAKYCDVNYSGGFHE